MISQSLSSPSDSLPSPLTGQISPAEGLYLQLMLDDLPALLPAPQLVEVMTVAIGQVVPIFQLPPWVMGVYNWRGEVLWLVDLNHLLGRTPWYEQPSYGSKHTVVVLREASESKERAIVGLVVSRVEEIVECSADRLHWLSELNALLSVLPEALPGSPIEVASAPQSEDLQFESQSDSLSESGSFPESQSDLLSESGSLSDSLPESLSESDSQPESNSQPNSQSNLQFNSESNLESNSQSNLQQNFLPVELHCFFNGYWQDENAFLYWLIDCNAILQSLSELPS